MGNKTRVLIAIPRLPGLPGSRRSAVARPDRADRGAVPAGRGDDIQGRVFAAAFQKSMGQNFIVDNRSGAWGLIGTQLVVESAPDGNTLLFSGLLSVVVTLSRGT